MTDDFSLATAKVAATAGGSFAFVAITLRWLIRWVSERMDKRQAHLDAEHHTLDMGWREFRLEITRELAMVKKQNAALHVAFQHVAGALIRIDPDNEALRHAERAMAAAFPVDFINLAQQAGDAVERARAKE